MSVISTGGMPVVRPAPISGDAGRQGLTLISDPHLGSAQTDLDLLEAELAEAKENGDRILLGGDVFDGINTRDKRFRADCVHPSLRGRQDLVNGALEMATAIFAPYASQIDAIGIGNHEVTVEQTGFDPVHELVRRLNVEKGAKIGYLGYTGFVEYSIEFDETRAGRFVIFFHHGAGKTTSAAAALAKLLKYAGSFQADVYWNGHSHCKAACHETVVSVRRGRIIHRDAAFVVTGGYVQGYGSQSQKSIMTRGRKSNYVSDGGLAPHGLGGASVLLDFENGVGFNPKVRVLQ